MAKDYDTRRKWNQMHHFPTQKNTPIVKSYWFSLFKKIYVRRKLHLLGNMKEEIRSVWEHGCVLLLCNIFILSFYRCFLWVLIKGNGIRFSFFPSQASSRLWMLSRRWQGNGLCPPRRRCTCSPLLFHDLNPWLAPFRACHLLLRGHALTWSHHRGWSASEGERVLSHTFFCLPLESTSQR